MRLINWTALHLILLLILIVLSEQRNQSDTDISIGQDGANDGLILREVSARNLRVNNNNHVDEVQPQQQAWQAVTNDETQEVRPQKRRRLRKRKRRPQHMNNNNGDPVEIPISEEPPATTRNLRRRRPVRLDEAETWKEMEAESLHRPYHRRRVGPVYQEQSPQVGPRQEITINIEQAKETTPQPVVNLEQQTLKDIKDILKQTGGLSLSEILLENNVTLADLLRGNQNAISALSERPLESATPKFAIDKVEKWQRQEMPEDIQARETQKPPQQQEQPQQQKQDRGKLKQNFDDEKQLLQRKVIEQKQFEEELSAMQKENSQKKDLEAQRQRLSQLYKQESTMFSPANKVEVITEATTEKRIFVPSHPKLYTSLSFKPDFETQTEETTKTSRLPVTSAKLNRKKGVTTPQPSSNGPLKMSFDLEELTKHNTVIPEGSSPTKSQDRSSTMRLIETTTEAILTAPIKSTIETVSSEDVIILDHVTTAETRPTSGKLSTVADYVSKFGKIAEQVSTTEKVSTVPSASDGQVTTTGEKVTVASAKDELLEIINNEDGKDRLAKILTSRNMTIEELLEQRERGSSQRHLADIFHNDTKEPEAVLEHVGTINEMPKSTEETPRRKTYTTVQTTTQRTYSTQNPLTTQKSVTMGYQKPLEDVSMNSEEAIVTEKLPSTSFPAYKVETNKIGKEIPPLHIPIWKTIYPSVYMEPEDVSNKKARKYDFDEIENSIRQAVDEDLNEISRSNNNNNFDYEDSIQLPLGVKSAIFASLAIIGMSLMLFLTILVIFKWTQKHKKKLCYGGSSNNGSFTCSKIKSPILQQISPTRTIRTFVTETLGKTRRNFYASQLRQHHHHQSHGVSDGWDSDRPYP